MDIHDLTLEARRILMTEVSELLEGVYGLRQDGHFGPADASPALRTHAEARETRQRLEKLLADEKDAGLEPREAVEKLVKETAFTHLNRLAAFKMLEARKLVRGTIDKLHDSNAYKFYLADDKNSEARKLHEAGTLPQDALGEGPRDAAYRRFLLWQCGELSKEIRVLFDPDDLASRLFPRPGALRQVIELLNAEERKEDWAVGNEETIGWIYQSFNARELEQAFRDVRLSGRKFEARDIPAVTQLFTPRWIVRFLVENTLARLWIAMHPDSALAAKLEYVVPFAGEAHTAPRKPAREITLLDPACGTMHFGLVAFDLLVAMYREEIQNQGKPGWPAQASVATEQEIPTSILACNLHGIDIDLRAVQLSSLTLYLKAKSLAPGARIQEANLACADVLLLDGPRIEEFLRASGLNRPVYGRLIDSLWGLLKGSRQIGSLLRLETEVRDLIAQEKAAAEKDRTEMPILPDAQRFGDAHAGGAAFWERLEADILTAFHEFAVKQAAVGRDARFFTGEAIKGFHVLHLMLRRYDVVVTNPPYISTRKMNAELKALVSAGYPNSKTDVYAAFIERCLELTAASGRLGMLTMHSFMFISSYEKLRTDLAGRSAIEDMVHLGPALFSVGNPGTLQTAAFVLRREPDAARREEAVGTYFRLVKEPDSDAKRSAFERAVRRLRAGEGDPSVYRYRQAEFEVIPGAPWVYWASNQIRDCFANLKALREIGSPRAGMHGGDRFRFARFWWEVGRAQIQLACKSLQESADSERRWFPYMKGGAFCRWYGNQEWVIRFDKPTFEILKNCGNKLPSRQFYFKPGFTWTDLTTGRFSARVSPGGFIFDAAGSSAFPTRVEHCLGIVNSMLAQYLLKLMNPTVHVQAGDLARLPIPSASSPALERLVEEAITLARTDSEDDETTYDFISPPTWPTGLDDVAARHARLAEVERQIDDEVYRLYGIGDEDRRAIEDELAEPVAADGEGSDDPEGGGDPEGNGEEEAAPSLTPEKQAKSWISYAAGIVLGRFTPREGTPPAGERWIGRGRFDAATRARLEGLIDADGVAVLDDGHPDDLARRVREALEAMLGEKGTREVVEKAIGGSGLGLVDERLRRYFERAFFKEHAEGKGQYRKRPVYWLLQSPGKEYSIYLFHERITGDTLPRLRGERYLQAKQNKVKNQAAELRARAQAAQGSEKRQLEKKIEAAEDLLRDLEAFDKKLREVLEAPDQSGREVGWAHEIDDGVILNLAPLRELMPGWSKESAKHWKELEAGEYDWSHTAMRYWPERVLAKCKTNKSYAIAHGRLDVYQGGS